ncbi:MAG: response regulator [Firmicutes bacterium]|jgi:two-component system chemotaxis response regulator CheY|nr:response regulator [Bacillota bacterium]
MRILIADDSAFMRMTLKNILISLNHQVIGEASDGYEAIEKYKSLKPDMVTMDITMPYLDGISAIEQIIKLDPHAHIIVCSAMGRPDFIMNAIKKGARGFIVKPFEVKSVVYELDRIDHEIALGL